MSGNCMLGTVCYAQIMPMVLLGVGDAIIQLALYTGFTYIVPEKYFGIAFGVLVSFQSLGMVFGTLICGEILGINTTKMDINLDNLSLIYVCIAAIGIIISSYLCDYDEKTKGNLNVAILEDVESQNISEKDEKSLSENFTIKVSAIDRSIFKSQSYLHKSQR
jgi:MFS family permease